MSKTIQRFGFRGYNSQGSKIPVDPFLNLRVERHTKDNEENIVISPDLYGNEEVDEYVDSLKKDLDRVAKEAKRFLRDKK